ncbi:MAG: hypothetical protein C5B50_28065 [Verrucomicrobia bacterium]|nr:MAG: hypothetical protein C5B50_28065 [Verrucomicrobiota bacterium]
MARKEDDAAIRRLLRDNPMEGDIVLSFEREPDYFRGTPLPGSDDQTILAFEGNHVVCMGRCSTRTRYLNGRPRRVAYLSELRLDRRFAGRADIVRRGYQFFEQLGGSADYYFTSIASDNERSIRLLERGLPGFPAYSVLGELKTVVIPVPSSSAGAKRLHDRASHQLRRWSLRHTTAAAHEPDHLAQFLNRAGERRQLASSWTGEELARLGEFGLDLADIHLVLEGDKIVGCVAIWDQRLFRQTVIRGYSRKLSLLRPWLNASARIFGFPRLPVPGSALAHAFLSPFAVCSEQPSIFVNLVQLCLACASSKDIEYVTLGLDAREPAFAAICKTFSCRVYSSRLYQVHWLRAKARPEPLDGRPLLPEIAFL